MKVCFGKLTRKIDRADAISIKTVCAPLLFSTVHCHHALSLRQFVYTVIPLRYCRRRSISLTRRARLRGARNFLFWQTKRQIYTSDSRRGNFECGNSIIRKILTFLKIALFARKNYSNARSIVVFELFFSRNRTRWEGGWRCVAHIVVLKKIIIKFVVCWWLYRWFTTIFFCTIKKKKNKFCSIDDCRRFSMRLV